MNEIAEVGGILVSRDRVRMGGTLALLAAVLAAPVPTGAHPEDRVEDGEPTTEMSDVSWYANAFDVTPVEALRRQPLQVMAGLLDEALTREGSPDYAGLWIEHEPEFRVIVATAGEASRFEASVRSATLRSELDGIVEVRTVRYSLAELRADQLALSDLVTRFKVSTSIDVMGNRVVAYPNDDLALAALRSGSLPKSVEFDGRVFVTEPAANAYAGEGLSVGCTSGFTLVYTTTNPDTYFTSTAGHCWGLPAPQPPRYAILNGVNVEYGTVSANGNYDLSYGNVGAMTPKNWMRVGPTTTRTVTGRTTRSQQAINSTVCKYGTATGQTCGLLVSTAFDPSYIPGIGNGFHLVSPNGGPDMVNPGDSGGPVYQNHSAWGITSGQSGLFFCVCDLIYSPIPYAEGNGFEQMQPLHVYYVP